MRILVFALLSVATTAWANDATFGGRGSNLIPISESAVRMAAEDIVAEYDTIDKDAWHVVATYTFENTSDAEVTLQMGFPEFHCNPEEGDCTAHKGKFVGLKTTVRGKEVPNKIGTVPQPNKWAPELGAVYLYDLTFAPKETVKIVHTYAFDGTEMSTGPEFEYLTRTGNLWSKPIGEATFTLRTPNRPWAVTYPPEYALVRSVETKTKGGGGVTEMVFKTKNWKPVRNLLVSLGSRDNGLRRMGLLKCRDALRESDNQPAWDKIVGAMTKSELAFCRNALYAHHGYFFKRAKYRKFFYGDTKEGFGDPGLPSADSTISPRWRYFLFRENSAYSPKLLTIGEQKLIKKLKKAERTAKKK